MKDKENVQKQINKLKQQHEEESILGEDVYYKDEIKNKEKELEKIINKNQILLNTYNHYNEISLKSTINKKNISYRINAKNFEQKKISSIEMNSMKKYYEQLEKYKYDGLLLLHKLIVLLKNLSQIKYDKSNYFSEILNDKNLKTILSLNLNKYSKDKISLINNYIITLISKFEIICKYIINKNNIYSLDKKNKEFIKEKQAKLILEKKKQISEELREIINI